LVYRTFSFRNYRISSLEFEKRMESVLTTREIHLVSSIPYDSCAFPTRQHPDQFDRILIQLESLVLFKDGPIEKELVCRSNGRGADSYQTLEARDNLVEDGDVARS